MKEQIAIQNLLRNKLSEIQRQNSRYSLRAYAKKVGVHPGALTYILSGKRNVSRKIAERIANRLMLDPQERSEILGLFPEKRAKRQSGEAAPAARYLEFSVSQFRAVAEWEHLAVMSLVNCEDFKSDPKRIAQRLGITLARAKQVIDRLVNLELLQVDAKGVLSRSKKSFRTADDFADLSIKKSHEETLRLAQESLHRDSIAARDFTSVTMAIDPGKIAAAKEIIRRAQDEVSDLLESGRRTQVYRMSVQLFPLTQIESGGK